MATCLRQTRRLALSPVRIYGKALNTGGNWIMKPFDFRGLFIYDLANNHQGDVEHALNIIRAMGQVTKETGVRGALKFQFR